MKFCSKQMGRTFVSYWRVVLGWHIMSEGIGVWWDDECSYKSASLQNILFNKNCSMESAFYVRNPLFDIRVLHRHSSLSYRWKEKDKSLP